MTDAEIILVTGLFSLVLGLFGFYMKGMQWIVMPHVNLGDVSLLFCIAGTVLLLIYMVVYVGF